MAPAMPHMVSHNRVWGIKPSSFSRHLALYDFRIQGICYNLNMATIMNDSEILSHLFSPETPGFAPEAARAVLALDFPQADRERMNALAQKARDGTLSPAEEGECQSYERVGYFLSLLQSKARQSLRPTALVS